MSTRKHEEGRKKQEARSKKQEGINIFILEHESDDIPQGYFFVFYIFIFRISCFTYCKTMDQKHHWTIRTSIPLIQSCTNIRVLTLGTLGLKTKLKLHNRLGRIETSMKFEGECSQRNHHS